MIGYRMRWGLIAALLPALLVAQDAKEVVRRAVDTDARTDQLARNYTFLQREDRKTLDGGGKVKETRIQTEDVTLVQGTPYHRLVARNDQPLSPDEQRWEDEKLRKSDQQRAKESPAQRQKRIDEWEEKRRKAREQNREIPEAFNFRIAGEEKLDGADVWVIEGTPRPGFHAGTMAARALLPKLNCRLWIAKSDYSWVKIDLETLDTVSFGLALLRIAKGSRIVIEQTRVNDEIWLPKRATVSASARLLLVKGMRIESQFDFSGYKKFQADSRIVGFQEKK